MKLYATIENEKGRREGVGSDNELIIELRHKNTRVRRFKFKLEDDTGGHNWEIEELDEGKTQQG